MKVLLDEHLSPLIAQALRDLGFDAQSVSARSDLMSTSDEALVEVATAEGRAVVTNNVKDFRPVAADRLVGGAGHGGLILLPARHTRTRRATGRLTEAIAEIMTAHPSGIADREVWVAPPPKSS